MKLNRVLLYVCQLAVGSGVGVGEGIGVGVGVALRYGMRRLEKIVALSSIKPTRIPRIKTKIPSHMFELFFGGGGMYGGGFMVWSIVLVYITGVR